MREQPSKRAIELRLEWLNKALGRPLTPDWGTKQEPEAAAFYIDHCNGGYRLECAGNPVFGHSRLTKTELCNQLEAILAAIRIARGENGGAAWPSECANHVTIAFGSRADTAYFLVACHEQVGREEQIGALKMGLMRSALQRAKAVYSNLTTEQAKAVRLGKAA